MTENSRRLYYGDNLKVLRDHIQTESVDLVYLDPPFNSQADYNVIFKGQDQKGDAAQITAFTDTWTWGPDDEQILFELTQKNGVLAQFLSETVTRLGRNSLSAYLVMMSVRLLELHRVLTPTGSLYLHVDPAASHYMKIVLDIIFGTQNFQNEVIWKRTHAHGSAKRWGDVHDVILFYTKTSKYVWNKVFTAYDASYIENFYKFEDERGRYRLVTITGAGTRTGDSGQPWRGVDPTRAGRHWAVPRELVRLVGGEDAVSLTSQEKLDLLDAANYIAFPKKEGGAPQYKQYLASMSGVPIQDVITDIGPLSPHAQERLGYPTQKPVALLERIISASSNPGDAVLDPFCGCGTTITAAEKLGRAWVGIDITHLSVSLIKARLRRDFGLLPTDYTEEGTPTTVEAAKYLFDTDPFEFQFWILGEIAAQPYGASAGSKKGKKGADGGIDGQMFFMRPDGGKVEKVIVSVKGGKNLTAGMVRDLAGVLTKENAAIGVFICLAPPTAGVLKEAAQQGGYEYGGKVFPRVQVLTVEDILGGKQPNIPVGALNVSYEQKQVKSLEKESQRKGLKGLFE